MRVYNKLPVLVPSIIVPEPIIIELTVEEARILEAIALHYFAKDDEQDLLAAALWAEFRR